jgi:uncharacterized membrane protein (DUF485 family)
LRLTEVLGICAAPGLAWRSNDIICESEFGSSDDTLQGTFMAGLDHGASFPKEEEDMVLAARNARYGMVLFIIYLLIYGGFVVTSAFWPEVMARDALFGVNLAITYGFALIAIAMVLALIYTWLCRARTSSSKANGS